MLFVVILYGQIEIAQHLELTSLRIAKRSREHKKILANKVAYPLCCTV